MEGVEGLVGIATVAATEVGASEVLAASEEAVAEVEFEVVGSTIS